MNILQERGRFWWHEEPLPPGQFAPQASITGVLTIDTNGRTSLELDGMLPGQRGHFETIMQQGLLVSDKYIQGLLTSAGKHVLLVNIINNGGGFSKPGPWRQNFLAYDCLVGPDFFVTGTPPSVHSMRIELVGLEDWLQLASITVKHTKKTTSAKYVKPKSTAFRRNGDDLKFEFGLIAPLFASARIKRREATLREHASLIYKNRSPVLLEEQRQTYGLLEDLLILLTGSELVLDWPRVSLDSKDRESIWYSWRDRPPTSTPLNAHECWTFFPQLRNDFGKIWAKWKTIRDQIGPGIYLYLGTRRGMRLYAEHRFVNLIWGIEAFHRKRNPSEPSDALSKKIERILGQIAKPSDANWLRRKLRHAHEPSLANRIANIIEELPIGLDRGLIAQFAEECATKRNAISHFGGAKDDDQYSGFAKRIDQLSDALTVLYHYLLLHEIGVDAKILNKQIHDGLQSHRIKRNFVEVGLMKAASKS